MHTLYDVGVESAGGGDAVDYLVTERLEAERLDKRHVFVGSVGEAGSTPSLRRGRR